jgi:hypothetical protein
VRVGAVVNRRGKGVVGDLDKGVTLTLTITLPCLPSSRSGHGVYDRWPAEGIVTTIISQKTQGFALLNLVGEAHASWQLSRCYIDINDKNGVDVNRIATKDVKVDRIKTWVAGSKLAKYKQQISADNEQSSKLISKDASGNLLNNNVDTSSAYLDIVRKFQLVLPAGEAIIAATNLVQKSDHKPTFFKTWARKLRYIVVSETHDAKTSKPVFHFQYFENKAAKKGAFAPNEPMFTFTLPPNGVKFGTFKAGKGANGVNKPPLLAQGTRCAKFLLANSEIQFIDAGE